MVDGLDDLDSSVMGMSRGDVCDYDDEDVFHLLDSIRSLEVLSRDRDGLEASEILVELRLG